MGGSGQLRDLREMAQHTRDHELVRRIGARVRRRRLALSFTQEELALRAGIKPATLSRVENARMHASIDLVKGIADALGCLVGELVDEEGPEVSGRERALLESWRALDGDTQRLVDKLVGRIAHGGVPKS